MSEISREDHRRYRERRHRDERRLSTMHPAKRFLAKAAIGIGIGLLPVSAYVEYDIAPERERLSRTQPEIVDIYTATDPSDRDVGVIDMVGLGNLSAEQTATTLSSYAELGNVMAVVYDNRGIDTDVIARTIEKKVYDQQLESVVLSGHSMGGDVALQVATYLYEETDIPLDAVILDCTPPTVDTVRPDEREKGLMMEEWLPYVPGGDVSRTVRFAVEMGARKDRYIQGGDSWRDIIDTDELKAAAQEVYEDKIQNEDAASNGLIESQFRVITSSKALHNLHALNQSIEGKTLPAIIYMRPKIARSDTVVDVERSQKLITDELGVFSGRLLIVEMFGTGHANPNQQPDEYNRAIRDEIVPFVERRQASQRSALLAKSVLEELGILVAEDE